MFISLESCRKELSNDINNFEIQLKIKPGNPLLLDQGRSSGDFVSNFQPSYINNYLIYKREIWCETFSHPNLQTCQISAKSEMVGKRGV